MFSILTILSIIGGLADTVQRLARERRAIAHRPIRARRRPDSRGRFHAKSSPAWCAAGANTKDRRRESPAIRGAFEIARHGRFLFEFAPSTDAVSSHHFDHYSILLGDERVRIFMAKANPAALR